MVGICHGGNMLGNHGDDVGDDGDVDVGRCSEQQKKRREDKDRCPIIIELLPRLLGRTQENASNL